MSVPEHSSCSVYTHSEHLPPMHFDISKASRIQTIAKSIERRGDTKSYWRTSTERRLVLGILELRFLDWRLQANALIERIETFRRTSLD